MMSFTIFTVALLAALITSSCYLRIRVRDFILFFKAISIKKQIMKHVHQHDTIVTCLQKQVDFHPNKPALEFENDKITYQQLDYLTNQIAHFGIEQVREFIYNSTVS